MVLILRALTILLFTFSVQINASAQTLDIKQTLKEQLLDHIETVEDLSFNDGFIKEAKCAAVYNFINKQEAIACIVTYEFFSSDNGGGFGYNCTEAIFFDGTLPYTVEKTNCDWR